MNKKLLAILACIATLSCSAQSGWTSLFDGKTLNGWKRLAGDAQYAVEDGMITGTTVAGFWQYFPCHRKRIWQFYTGAGYKN